MKRTFTLVLASFIAFTFFGQSEKINYQENKISLNNFQTKNNDDFKSIQVIKHQLDSAIYEDYDQTINEWVVDAKEECIYDENLNMVQSTWSYWEEGQWVATDKYEYTYDDDGYVILYLPSYWHENTNQWVINYKVDYTYNSNSDLSLKVETNWDMNTNEWELTYKKEYSYDTDWKLTSTIDFHWEEDINDWVNGDEEAYAYDNNGYLQLVIKHEWDPDISEWKLNEKRDYTCDADGNVTSIITSYMNNNTNEWSVYKKHDYAYDVNENPTVDALYYWDATATEWLEDSKYEYSYDLAYSLSDLILPPTLNYFPAYSGNISNMAVDFLRYGYDETNWQMELKGTYHYSEQDVTGVFDILGKNVKVFPNPASENLTVSFSGELQNLSFNLINIQGQRVIEQTISNHEQIDIKQVPKGLYLYQLSNKNKIIQSGKIVIE